jgi:hypothetical protein
MSVTVVVRRRARPGQEELMFGLAIGAIQRPRARTSSTAQVFQGLTDPAAMLYLGQWNSRESYESRDTSHLARLDALCEGPAYRAFCHQLSLYEIVSSQVQVAACLIIRAPEGCVADIVTYLHSEAALVTQAQPGFVLRAVYQDLDDPGQLFVLVGWRSAAEQDAARRSVLAATRQRLQELGAAIEDFRGRTRAEIEREVRRSQ